MEPAHAGERRGGEMIFSITATAKKEELRIGKVGPTSPADKDTLFLCVADSSYIWMSKEALVALRDQITAILIKEEMDALKIKLDGTSPIVVQENAPERVSNSGQSDLSEVPSSTASKVAPAPCCARETEFDLHLTGCPVGCPVCHTTPVNGACDCDPFQPDSYGEIQG